jgi:RNA polymerase sigma-70 factor (ECF subfamily)
MWPDPNETQELLRQADHGDGAAVGRLLERHRESLRRAIHLRLDRAIQRRVDASDIVQEVMLEASRRLPEYLKNPIMPFHLWLRQMARDRLIDAHRRHQVAERRAIDREQPIELAAFLDRSSIELAADLRDRELTPAAAAIRQELERRFQDVLAQLDDEDRDILIMRYFEQLSNQEAAQALGLSEAAAGMRHLRALRRLRTLLGESPSQVGLR